MKKVTIILCFAGLAAVTVIAMFGLIYGGADFAGLNYVRIEVNPKVEFVLKGEKIISYYPINAEAKELLVQEEFMGLNIGTATQKFVDLCTRAGYIDVDGKENVILVGSSSAVSHALQVKIYNSANNYLKNNEIFGTVVESQNIETNIKKAKKNRTGVERLLVIESYLRLSPNKTMGSVKLKSNAGIIRKIRDIHRETNSQTEFTAEDLVNKKLLIDLNRIKFANHQEKITSETQSKFNEEYVKVSKKLKKEFLKDFDGPYQLWKTSHINFVD